jgi:hypothetical protein
LLHVAIRSREAAWSPRHVAHERARVTLAADTHRTATVRAVEAANTTDPAQRADFEHHAAETAALASTPDERATELQQVEARDPATLADGGHADRARSLVGGTRSKRTASKNLLAVTHAPPVLLTATVSRLDSGLQSLDNAEVSRIYLGAKGTIDGKADIGY